MRAIGAADAVIFARTGVRWRGCACICVGFCSGLGLDLCSGRVSGRALSFGRIIVSSVTVCDEDAVGDTVGEGAGNGDGDGDGDGDGVGRPGSFFALRDGFLRGTIGGTFCIV